MNSLGLKAGDWVEVRSRDEILATLDSRGSLDGMPFMPEMLRYCGQRVRIFKRAHKTCDTAKKTGGRRVLDTVHLQNLRCDGSAHGGCEAGCMLFWKSAWVKRVNGPAASPDSPADLPVPDSIARGCYYSGAGGPEADVRYRCQANELFTASAPLKWWELGQYIEDLTSRNIGIAALLRGAGYALLRSALHLGIGYRILVRGYRSLAGLIGARPFPMGRGTNIKTPTEVLDLQPGEWVRVKSHEQILATLDANNRNRGLFFDIEAAEFCGREFRVQKRVTRILDENSGEMVHFKNPCIVLENVWCGGEVSTLRVFCPRAIFPYWREIWLERIPGPGAPQA